MKSSMIFWSVFFISLGLALLLNQLEINLISYSKLLIYWPLILIFWGISLINLPGLMKFLTTSLFAIFCALLFMGLMVKLGFVELNEENDLYEYYSYEKLDNDGIKQKSISKMGNIDHAGLELGSGLCKLIISDTSPGLIEAYPSGSLRDYFIKRTDDKNQVKINMKMKPSLRFDNMFPDNQMTLKLNKSAIWNLNFDIGATDFHCDLREFHVDKFYLNSLASNVVIWFGYGYNKIDVDINGGGSNIVVNVPSGSSCRIISSAGLSSEKYGGFISRDGCHFSDNSQSAIDSIGINLTGGLSNFELNRY